jgi:chromosome segregation ATPase
MTTEMFNLSAERLARLPEDLKRRVEEHNAAVAAANLARAEIASLRTTLEGLVASCNERGQEIMRLNREQAREKAKIAEVKAKIQALRFNA